MLDLKMIFDPDRKPPAPAAEIGPDDLPGDWRVEWEERAAIMEYDGQLPREQAEHLAMIDVLRAMERAGEPVVRNFMRPGRAARRGA